MTPVSLEPATARLPAGVPPLRSRLLAAGAWCLLATQVALVLLIALSVIDERQTGSWRMMGAGIVVSVAGPPVALAGLGVALVLLLDRHQRRLVPGLLLLTVSIVMLSGDVPFQLGRALADSW